MTYPAVVKARLEAAAARADLETTLAELKERLAPRHIAQTAWDGVRDRGEDLAERGVEFATRKPGLTGGVAALAALIVVRKPVRRLFGKLFSRRGETAAAPPPLNPTDRPAAAGVQEEILP